MHQRQTKGRKSTRLRIVIAHEDQLELIGVAHALDHDSVEVVGEAHTVEQIVPLVDRTRPDVLFVSGEMATQRDATAISVLQKRYPSLRLLVLCASAETGCACAARLPVATSVILTSVDPANLAGVIAEGMAGHIYFPPSGNDAKREQPLLTDRELSVLRAAARGLSNDAIGHELWLSPHTVKGHLHRIYLKLGVANRTELVRFAIDEGLLDEDHSGAAR